MSAFVLEPDARLALDVALGLAGTSGDEHCGTEHVLFGIVATAVDGVAELTELFALDHLRVGHARDAAVRADVGGDALEGHDGDGAGGLGLRA